jgi:hypothetical protein
MRIKEWSFISFSVVALAACGGSGGTSASGSTGSGAGAHDSPYGDITITHTFSLSDLNFGEFSATFVEQYKAASADCVRSTVANCSISVCSANSADNLRVGAGDLTVDVLLTPNGAPFTVGPIQVDANMVYSTWLDTPMFSGGEIVTVKASGGQVPAFSVSATAPHTIELTAPDLVNQNFVELNTAYDFPVAWMNGKDGTVEVELHSSEVVSNSLPKYQMTCVFPAASGKGVVPAAALQKLSTTVGKAFDGQGSIRLVSHALVNAGAFETDVSLVTSQFIEYVNLN